jgi:SLIT-ROBO Rho GTPase activating protein
MCPFSASLPTGNIISCFHSGEDPLVDDQNERDINSVAGVLKLYFRGLENPLFPKERFQDLISTISKYFPVGAINSLRTPYCRCTMGLVPRKDIMKEVWSSSS